MTELIIALLDTEWRGINSLCADFDEATWSTPVALPGWTVKDCLSHMAGTESTLLGVDPPSVPIDHLEHVKSPFQEITEMPVELRRSWTGGEVLDDFRRITIRRVDQLSAMSEEDLAKVGWSPLGEAPYRDFMGVRLFDCWMHEQDMRRAADRPGHVTGPEVDTALNRFRAAVPYVVGKKAAAPEGATVVFATTGDGGICWTIAVTDGRAKVVGETEAERPDAATVTIDLPFTTFVALGGGRWSPDEARAHGPLDVAGDQELGERILANLAFTP
jgi:uncharacterized protein (TIGR03083 family)